MLKYGLSDVMYSIVIRHRRRHYGIFVLWQYARWNKRVSLLRCGTVVHQVSPFLFFVVVNDSQTILGPLTDKNSEWSFRDYERQYGTSEFSVRIFVSTLKFVGVIKVHYINKRRSSLTKFRRSIESPLHRKREVTVRLISVFSLRFTGRVSVFHSVTLSTHILTSED